MASNITKKYLGILFCSLLVPCEAIAEKKADSSLSALQEEIHWLQEESFVSIATKTLENIEKSGATISIITAKELRDMGARNLMDALKRVPGLGVNQFNMGMSSVEVRGVKTDFGEKVLFLVNGHPINNNLVNGGAQSSYNNFIVDDIQKVEIIRGPGSALYGANAFIAVINIITKEAKDINGTTLSVGAGSYNTRKMNLSYGNDGGPIEIAINLNAFDTDGFKGDIESDAILAIGEAEYWRQRYELGFQLNSGNYSLQGKYLQRQSGPFLGAINVLNDDSEQEYIEYFIEAGYQRTISNKLSFNSTLYLDHFQFDNLWELFPESPANPDGFLVRSPIKHDKHGAEIQLEYQISHQHKLLGGLMGEHQSQYDVEFWSNNGTGPLQNISSVANWNGSHNRDILAAFVQDIWDINKDLRLISGARYDHYSDFGGSFNPRASLMWEFIENYNLIATYGSAFRAPTFGELYNINNPSIVGNPDVKPEEIDTFELGVNGNLTKRTKASITLFQNNIEELITSTPTLSSVNESGNKGELKVQGAEMELSSRLRSGSNFSLNYTYQYPVNQLTDKRVADVPIHKANASFNFRHSKYVNAYAGILYRGSLNRADGDTRSKVDDFFTLDLALTIQNYIDNLDIKASVYNLFDKQYFDPSPAGVMVSDYPKQGRDLMVEFSYKL